jgi:hypothetical protein
MVKPVKDEIEQIILNLQIQPSPVDAYKGGFEIVKWYYNQDTKIPMPAGSPPITAPEFFRQLPTIEYNATIHKLGYTKEYSIFYAFIFTVYPDITKYSSSNIHKIVSEFRKQFTKDSIEYIIANAASKPTILLEEFVQELFAPKPQQILSNILTLLSLLYSISIIVIEPTTYNYNGQQTFSEVHPFIHSRPTSVILYYNYVTGYANIQTSGLSTIFNFLQSYKEENLVSFAPVNDIPIVQKYFQWLILQRGISYANAQHKISTELKLATTDNTHIINANFTQADAFRHRITNVISNDDAVQALICKSNNDKYCISVTDLFKNGRTIPDVIKQGPEYTDLFTRPNQPSKQDKYALEYNNLQAIILTLGQFNNIDAIKQYAGGNFVSDLPEFIIMLIHSIISLKEVTDALLPDKNLLIKLKTDTHYLFLVLATIDQSSYPHRNGIVDLLTILEKVIDDCIQRRQKLDDAWKASLWQYVLAGAAGLAIGGLMARIKFVKRGQDAKNNKRERKMV